MLARGGVPVLTRQGGGARVSLVSPKGGDSVDDGLDYRKRTTLFGLATTTVLWKSFAKAAETEMTQNSQAPLPTSKLSASEQIMHTTVRLEMPELGGRTGTGFHFAFYKQNDVFTPVIITNRHVIEGADIIHFRMTKMGSDGLPSIGNTIAFRIDNLQSRVMFHPHADLAAIIIGDVLSQSTQQGNRPFFISLDQSLIPTDDDLKKLVPLESVLTIGYPGQLWDDLNNLPLFHRGSTATAPYIDFRGKKEFLVDFATWPGASGSPLFIFNEGSYFDSRSGSLSVGTSRILLIGVVYGVAVQEVTGNVVIQQAPTQFAPTPLKSATNVPTNLGACLRASQILELEALLGRFGIVPPLGYVPRASP